MVVEDKEIEKICSFYISEYHLEMILLPFINDKIENNKKVIIETEYNLEETLKRVLERTNLKQENKNKILSLGCNSKEKNKLEDKSNIIVIGNKEYIKNANNEIIKNNLKNITVVDCYKFEELGNDVTKIQNSYACNLNTNGIKNINK